MSLSNFLLMQQEILLLLIILTLIIAEIFISKNNKVSIIHIAILLFGIHTTLGFFTSTEGYLFGGTFKTNNFIYFFKNVLNVGVFIILLQSADWIKQKLFTQDRGTEFFILLFCSLLGMYFMISSGDFLMFYLGLELSTLPVAALAAIETSKRFSNESGLKLILSAALASGVSLFGISLLYATSGSIYFDIISTNIVSNNLTILAFLLFFAGLAFKISLVPKTPNPINVRGKNNF